MYIYIYIYISCAHLCVCVQLGIIMMKSKLPSIFMKDLSPANDFDDAVGELVFGELKQQPNPAD